LFGLWRATGAAAGEEDSTMTLLEELALVDRVVIAYGGIPLSGGVTVLNLDGTVRESIWHQVNPTRSEEESKA
jgi:hypothetical protein